MMKLNLNSEATRNKNEIQLLEPGQLKDGLGDQYKTFFSNNVEVGE